MSVDNSTLLEYNRENGNGYDLIDIDDEAFLVFNEAMKELDRPMILGNAIGIDCLKKYTVVYKDGHAEKLNLMMCSGGSLIGNCFYLKKLGYDEYCIYTTPNDIDLVSRMRQKIRWTTVEVRSVLFDPADSLPLDSNQENGYNFIANYGVHFVGAMRELGRTILDVNTLNIESLKKYTVKHEDGHTEKLNLVQCLGGGLPGNNFYLQKVKEYDFRIYTVADDDDFFSSNAKRLANIRWSRKEVLSVVSDPVSNTPLDYSRQKGYFFEGNYDTHFIGAMKELGRPIIIENAFMIRRLRKYTVTYNDGRTEESNLVWFKGGSEPGNEFYLQEMGENDYCIYTLIGDDDPKSIMSSSLENIHWTEKEVSSIIPDTDLCAPLEYSPQNGCYFEGNYDTHFMGAMRKLGRPIILENAIIIKRQRKYTVKHLDDQTEELNLVRFSGGSRRGNEFHLQKLDENNFCIYTVLRNDNPSSSAIEKPVHIRWTKKEVMTVYSTSDDDIPSHYGQPIGYHFEGNYHVHFVGAMRELGRPILHNTYKINELRKYTVKYRDDRTEQLNLVRFAGGSKPGNRFFLQKVDENDFCIYTVIGDNELTQ